MPNEIHFNNDYPVIDESFKIYEKGKKIIPSATQTLAKGPGQFTKGVAPIYLQKGKGSHVWDVDGNEFLDYNMGIGPIILGYCYDPVDAAIKEQLNSGITFSLMHPLEVQTAELIQQIIPNAESVRFSKTGADVTSAAIRLARAYTGRDKILCCGYHGWHDWYISVTDRYKGIPQPIKDLSFTFNYNDINSLIDSIDEDTAAVILEPFVFNEPENNFLQDVRDVCDGYGTVLIFDEMWTGFRISPGGAQRFFNVNADIALFSKAIANGMPLSVILGTTKIMKLLEKDVFFYTTFGGETLSLAAAVATINEIITKDVTSVIAQKGNVLKSGINTLISSYNINYLNCIGYPCRSMLSIDASAGNPLEIKTFIQQEMIKRGILWSGFHTISFSHSDKDIAYTLSAYNDILPILNNAIQNGNLSGFIRGELIETVFRRVGNFNTKPKQKEMIED
jgi:glutamate-1-semialdehyde 2,1-aminomutase